ncbi:hypothetical protein D049_3993B, partial [Vibrio parahaemolyticus VPTS-2010]
MDNCSAVIFIVIMRLYMGLMVSRLFASCSMF